MPYMTAQITAQINLDYLLNFGLCAYFFILLDLGFQIFEQLGIAELRRVLRQPGRAAGGYQTLCRFSM